MKSMDQIRNERMREAPLEVRTKVHKLFGLMCLICVIGGFAPVLVLPTPGKSVIEFVTFVALTIAWAVPALELVMLWYFKRLDEILGIERR